MMKCAICREQLEEFVLGQCDAETTAVVADHLRICPDCQREADAWADAWATLPDDLPMPAKLPKLRGRVLAALDGPIPGGERAELVRRLAEANAEPTRSATPETTPAPSTRERQWSLALAASVLLALGVGAWWSGHMQRDARRRDLVAEQRAASQLAERLGGLIRAKGATPTTRFDLAPVGQRENGLVHVAWDRAVNQWHVFAVDAPPAPAGSAYCFWFVTAAGEYVATVLEETAPGVMATAATLPAKPSDVRRAVVTLEKLPPGERPRGEALWETAVVGDAQ